MNVHFEKFCSFIQKITPIISEEEVEIFFSKSQHSKLEKGQLFVKEGAICNHLLFIHQGALRYYFLHEGQDVTKDFAVDTQNPLCTAYTSFMLQKPSEIWIEALEPCTVSIWHNRDVLPLFQDHPIWLRFAKRMADQLFYRKERKELELLKYSAEERYRHFLLEFPGVSQRVPQYHIATFLGITPESLSRIRSKFSKAS
jgi:CRP-like cAMP-binding protein